MTETWRGGAAEAKKPLYEGKAVIWSRPAGTNGVSVTWATISTICPAAGVGFPVVQPFKSDHICKFLVLVSLRSSRHTPECRKPTVWVVVAVSNCLSVDTFDGFVNIIHGSSRRKAFIFLDVSYLWGVNPQLLVCSIIPLSSVRL